MSRLAERIQRLKEELARHEEIKIVAPAWAQTPIGQQPPAAAEPAAPAVETLAWIDTTRARKPRTPRRRRRARGGVAVHSA